MASFRVLKGSYANLSNVPIAEGQLIFTTDEGNRQIFLDIDDNTRIQITSPLIEEDDVIILNGGGAPNSEQEAE